MGFFTGTKDKVKFFEPEYSQKSRKELYGLGTAAAPEQPLRKIAGLSDLEMLAQRIAEQFMQSGVPQTRQVATQEALKTATEPVDVMKLPEAKGLIERIAEEGNLMANRLSRGLQIKGASATTGGRDVLGRSVTGTQERMVSAFIPLIQQLRSMRYDAISKLEGITRGAEETTMKKIGVGGEVGQMSRLIKQAVNDAQLDKVLREIQFRFGIQPNILQSILVNPQAYVSKGGPSELDKITKAAGQIAGLANMVGGAFPSGGGGSGVFSPGGAQNLTNAWLSPGGVPVGP